MNLKSIRKTHVTIGGVLIALASVGTVYGWSDDFGIDLPKLAWQSDVQSLEESDIVIAGSIEGLLKIMDTREIIRLRQLEDDLILKIATAEASGKPPNPLDVLKLQQIRRQIDDLRAQE